MSDLEQQLAAKMLLDGMGEDGDSVLEIEAVREECRESLHAAEELDWISWDGSEWHTCKNLRYVSKENELDGLSIGCDHNGVFFLTGSLAEIRLFHCHLPMAQRVQIEVRVR